MNQTPVLNPQRFFHDCQITQAVNGRCPVCDHPERSTKPYAMPWGGILVAILLVTLLLGGVAFLVEMGR